MASCTGCEANHLHRVAAQKSFRAPHRLLAQCMLYQRDVVVLMHMVGLRQVVPAQPRFSGQGSQLQCHE